MSAHAIEAFGAYWRCEYCCTAFPVGIFTREQLEQAWCPAWRVIRYTPMETVAELTVAWLNGRVE